MAETGNVVPSLEKCIEKCFAKSECVAFTYQMTSKYPRCYLKSKVGSSHYHYGLISGIKEDFKPFDRPSSKPIGIYTKGKSIITIFNRGFATKIFAI